MVQKGDSLTGTAYYYESSTRYRRYSIKGYLDDRDNSVVWWDDQLLEDKTKGLNLFHRLPSASSRADFNCPGNGVMMLDGKMYEQDPQTPKGDVHLTKVETAAFEDEWNNVIEDYTVGANDRNIIDSVSGITTQVAVTAQPNETMKQEHKGPVPVKDETLNPGDSVIKKETIAATLPDQEAKMQAKITAPTIEQKFASREKTFSKEIPLTGDSIELRFYDNAEIDGDSISLFLNGKLIFEHIALTEKAYVVKLAVNDLDESNELTMVAENLGSIPPNTSYMVAIVGDKRYDAQLASTENSSAMIRLSKSISRKP